MRAFFEFINPYILKLTTYLLGMLAGMTLLQRIQAVQQPEPKVEKKPPAKKRTTKKRPPK